MKRDKKRLALFDKSYILISLFFVAILMASAGETAYPLGSWKYKENENIKNTVVDMAEVASSSEKTLNELSKNFMKLKDEANQSLHNILIIVFIASILIFMVFSFLLSNIIIKSINNLIP